MVYFAAIAARNKFPIAYSGLKDAEEASGYLKINDHEKLVFEFDNGSYNLRLFDAYGRAIAQHKADDQAVFYKNALPKGVVIVTVNGMTSKQGSNTYKISNW